MEGISLIDHITSGGKTDLPGRYLFWDLYGKEAAVSGPWKIVAHLDNHNGKFAKGAAAAMKADFELFNLDKDLGETHNLAQDYPEIYKDLKSRFVSWLKGASE